MAEPSDSMSNKAMVLLQFERHSHLTSRQVFDGQGLYSQFQQAVATAIAALPSGLGHFLTNQAV